MTFRASITFLVSLFLGLFDIVPAKSAVVGSFPVTLHEGFIWMTVSVGNNEKPLHFLLDSGAATSILDLSVARHLGLHLGKTQPIKGVNALCTAFRVTGFKAVASGTALPDSLLALDCKSFGIECDRHVDGLIGADFFRDHIVKIDYAARKVLLLDSVERNAEMQELPAKILNKCLCVPLQIAGRPNQWMRVDTGYDSALEWCASGAKIRTTHETSVGLSGASVHYIQTNIKIGQTNLHSVNTGIHEHQIFAGEAGLLGNELLSKFKVTFDTRHKKLFLEPSVIKG